MSGGSYEYTYERIENLAEAMRDKGGCDCAPQAMRAAFKAHLKLIARACRAIEWNDSGDGDDTEVSLLTNLLSPADVVSSALDDAKRYLADMHSAIRIAERMQIKKGL